MRHRVRRRRCVGGDARITRPFAGSATRWSTPTSSALPSRRSTGNSTRPEVDSGSIAVVDTTIVNGEARLGRRVGKLAEGQRTCFGYKVFVRTEGQGYGC